MSSHMVYDNWSKDNVKDNVLHICCAFIHCCRGAKPWWQLTFCSGGAKNRWKVHSDITGCYHTDMNWHSVVCHAHSLLVHSLWCSFGFYLIALGWQQYWHLAKTLVFSLSLLLFNVGAIKVCLIEKKNRKQRNVPHCWWWLMMLDLFLLLWWSGDMEQRGEANNEETPNLSQFLLSQ